MFADDLKLFTRIFSITDCVRLQRALDTLLRWCERNRLSLNVSKCHVMSYTKKCNKILYNYRVDKHELSRLTEYRDLGVLCDSQCSFVPHLNQLISSVSKTYGYIIRNGRRFNNSNTLIILFNSFIRSKLEYCSIIWRPIYSCHKKRIESVQRKFYKYLVWREDGVYPNIGCCNDMLLGRFGAEPIEQRVK
ncbi:uncharacterized protein LOC123306582 [Coccinella septempunctata]|uniref:uncharacterized protein LOC123306582 n=1 Tax=Coccinella septempunctata TaxID=41139 RepID=UPI001D089043|nr:uncharacterized protein LOC123306582 [Coccinella septempunctata]